MGFYALIGISMVFGLIGSVVSGRLKSKFAQYAQIPTSSGLSGKEIAERMLRHYNVLDVEIVQGKGRLTDHYNPKTKTIALSPEVYGGRSVAAAAVAAHECGHAVQHAESYAMLTFRSAIVPVVQLSANLQQYVFMAAIFMAGSMNNGMLLMGAIALFGITTLFSVITLPVEFDASSRALAWLDSANITRGTEYDGAKDALKWAAMTYVVAALAAVAQLLYLVMMFMGSRD